MNYKLRIDIEMFLNNLCLFIIQANKGLNLDIFLKFITFAA